MLIHEYFGLSYSSHLVISRTLLQSMPEEWQTEFVNLLQTLDSAYEHIDRDTYQVIACQWKEAWELSDAEREEAGVTSSLDDFPDPSEGATEEEITAHDDAYAHALDNEVLYRNGIEIDKNESVPVPVPEQIPPYQRGRTYLEPHL